MTKTLKLLSLSSLSLLLLACTSVSVPEPVRSPSFTSGSQDGCATAMGEYTKNSDAFHHDPEYNKGWFYGRKKCNPSQAQS